MRNPGVAPATIARVYRIRANPDYFPQAIAANPRTPFAVLRDLYRRPGMSPRLDATLADNPAMPAEVIRAIAATTRDADVRRAASRESRENANSRN